MAKLSTKRREAALPGQIRWAQVSAPTGLTADDVDKLWLDTDAPDLAIWMCTGFSPITWRRMDPNAAQATADAATVAAAAAQAEVDSAPALRDTLLAASYELVALVRCAITGTLPAYTASGAAGARVLTGTGSLPAQFTDGVTTADGDPILIPYNPTAPADAGIYVKATSGGNWRLTQSTTINTAATLGSSTVRVAEGRCYAGRLFTCVKSAAEITAGALGTLALMWRLVGERNGLHGFSNFSDFTENSAAVIAGASANALYCGFHAFTQGTASGIVTSSTNNSASIYGEGVFSTGTTTTGNANLYTGAFNVADARYEIDYEVEFQVPVVSDGTNTFSVNFGFGAASTTDFGAVKLVPTAGAAISYTSAVGGVAGTPIALGTFAINTVYRIAFRKAFGATVFDVFFDAADGLGLVYKGTTSALPATTYAGYSVTKSAGPLSRDMRLDSVRFHVYDPFVRGA